LLRQVDAAAHRHREVIGEQYPPEERLALLEAILEIDRVLALDEWDAESWNFRSAWCLLLRRFEQAITAADRALGLRPTGYAKPHHNRGIALAALKRNDEARGVLQRSLEEARSAGSQQDVELASRTLAGIDAEPPLTPDTFSAVITRLNTASGITQLELFASFYEGKDTNVPSLARSIRDRILVVARDRWHMGYIPVLDELLGDMGPEATFRLLVEMSQDARPVFDYFCRAAMYIAAQGEGAARRDGARLVLLIVLAPERPDEVKSLYRRMVLASAAVSPGPLAKLGQVMKEEIARVHFMLAEFLADQPEVTPAEREAPQALVGELSGPIPSVPYLTEYSRAAGGTHTPLPRAAAVVAWLFWIGILAGFVALARWWF
jgi:tetratricopeptide (TPR) repeat protein